LFGFGKIKGLFDGDCRKHDDLDIEKKIDDGMQGYKKFDEPFTDHDIPDHRMFHHDIPDRVFHVKDTRFDIDHQQCDEKPDQTW
jgi:hypothetical protein